MNDVPLKMNNNKNEHMIIINSKRQTNEKKKRLESRLQYEDSGRHPT